MKTQRGNILFLILLAVVLFAALTYAVMRDERGQVKSASTESLQAKASQILQYATLLQNTVNRLMITNDCTYNQISFENPVTNALGTYAANKLDFRNPRAPADKRCNVFDPAGGGMSYMVMDDATFLSPLSAGNGTQDYTRGYTYFYAGVFVTGVGDDTKADVLFVIPWLSQGLCLAINDLLGQGTGTPSNFNNMVFTLPVGPSSITDTSLQSVMASRPNLHSYCGRYLPFVPYMFYHVVMTR